MLGNMLRNDSENIEVGILIPTYNRIKFLKKALESSVHQTYKNIKIIVIDNGSTDGTPEFMASVHDARVSYVINDQNLGLSGSVNKGIRLMSDEVEWCTVVCDDDYVEKNYISEMLQFLRQHPELIVAYGHIIFADVNLKIIKSAMTGPEVEGAQSYLEGRAYRERDTYLSAVIFHKRSFTEIGGYPSFTTGWATDDALIFHLGAKGKIVGFNRNALCYIRLHESAESIGFPGGIGKNFQAALDFKNYCVKVAKAYGLNENVIINFTDFRITNWLTGVLLNKYEKLILSNLLKKDNAVYHEFRETLRLVRAYLPIRFKVTMFLVKAFGIYFEKYRFYRFLWRTIQDILKIAHWAKRLFVQA